MTTNTCEVQKNTYQDSVRLMRVSQGLSGLNGVEQAIVVMGTDANKRVMEEIGLLTDAVEQAGPNDLVIVIEAVSDETAQEALEKAQEILSGEAEGSQSKSTEEVPFRTAAGYGAKDIQGPFQDQDHQKPAIKSGLFSKRFR